MILARTDESGDRAHSSIPDGAAHRLAPWSSIPGVQLVRFLLPNILGLIVAIVGVLSLSAEMQLGAAAVLAGVYMSFIGQRAVRSSYKAVTKAYGQAYCEFISIGVDLVSILVLIVSLGASGTIHMRSALIGATIYIVVLLCSLIKSNALRVSPYKKAMRIGRLAKLSVGLVLLAFVAPKVQVLSPFLSVEVADVVTELIAALALSISMRRAATVSSRLSLLDPTPAGAA